MGAIFDQVVAKAWDFVRPKLVAMNREKGPAGVWSTGFRSGWEAHARLFPAESDCMSAADRAELVAGIALSKFERRVFEALNRRFGKWVHVAELTDAVYWDDPNGGPANPSATLGNFASRLRRKLAPVGLTIDWHPGGAGRRLIWMDRR